MIDLRAHGLLFAERSMLRDMGSGFREKREHFDASDLAIWFCIVLGILAAIACLSRLVARQDKRQLFNSPRALFRNLCRAHALDRPARRLLRQMSRYQKLSQPARLFLEPARFEPENLSPAQQSQFSAVLALRDHLFAATEPAENDNEPAPLAASTPAAHA